MEHRRVASGAGHPARSLAPPRRCHTTVTRASPTCNRAPLEWRARMNPRRDHVLKYLKLRIAALALGATVAATSISTAQATDITGAGASFIFPVMTKWSV